MAGQSRVTCSSASAVLLVFAQTLGIDALGKPKQCTADDLEQRMIWISQGLTVPLLGCSDHFSPRYLRSGRGQLFRLVCV